MEEHQVTQEGETRPLPEPFFVIATQNPSTQVGTFALPESQLDRFLMRIALGYPDEKAERALFQGRDRRDIVSTLEPRMTPAELALLQRAVHAVHVSEALLDYLQSLVSFTRESRAFVTGLSPRAGLALLRGAQAWALMQGREYALPEDLQTVLPSVTGHRLKLAGDGAIDQGRDIASMLLHEVPIP
jgi:MoxR-like ATPase